MAWHADTDRRVKCFRIVRLTPRHHNLELYAYYPDDPVNHGPYCIQWIPIVKRDISRLTRRAAELGIVPLESVYEEEQP